jgi:hypothetical protein
MRWCIYLPLGLKELIRLYVIILWRRSAVSERLRHAGVNGGTIAAHRYRSTLVDGSKFRHCSLSTFHVRVQCIYIKIVKGIQSNHNAQ